VNLLDTHIALRLVENVLQRFADGEAILANGELGIEETGARVGHRHRPIR
jgi:hypothetical protein